MKITVLDAATLDGDVTFEKWEALGEVMVHKTTPAEEVIDRLKGSDVAILNKVKITADVVDGKGEPIYVKKPKGTAEQTA